MSTKAKIDWEKTLNHIVHTHKHDEVVFSIKDIEALATFVNSLVYKYNDTYNNLELERSIAFKRFKELEELKARAKTEPLDKFKIYA